MQSRHHEHAFHDILTAAKGRARRRASCTSLAQLLSRVLACCLACCAACCLAGGTAAAATLGFTVNVSKPVTVTGTPRLAIDVGGVTRYAGYVSGSGSAALTFTYAIQPGDFDGNGIGLTSPLQLNGGTITDSAGRPATNLAFTLPDSSSVKVQTYTAALNAVSNTTATAAGFTITGAPAGASFTYAITSSGGAGSITGSGTISGTSHAVSGVNVSALPSGTLTLSVTVSTAAGGTGAARTATVTPGFSGGLDGLPAAAAAFSVRRLRSAYSGPLLRVRRASDGTGLDIGSTVGGTLDTASLASFCGSGSCFVSTWYDQSGNGRHATQATASAQPALVSTGTLEQLGSRPGLRFTTGRSMSAPGPLASANEYTASLVLVERVRSINTTVRLTASASATNRVLAYIPYLNGTFYFDQGTATSPNRVALTWTVPIDTPAIATLRNSAAAPSRSVYVSGRVLFSNSGGFAAPSDTLFFGEDYQGHISEVLVFPSSITNGDRLTLEQGQGAYYGISVP